MTHGPTLPGGCFPTRKILPPTPTPGNIRCNWGHFGCYNLEGGCCWCSGGTGQAGCSMPIARRTVCTKDYLDQKVHSADREKPCPQAARGPAVRRTLPGLLTLSGAGSLVRSSHLLSLSWPPHHPPRCFFSLAPSLDCFFAFLTGVGCPWTENPSTGFVRCLIPRVWTWLC